MEDEKRISVKLTLDEIELIKDSLYKTYDVDFKLAKNKKAIYILSLINRLDNV